MGIAKTVIPKNSGKAQKCTQKSGSNPQKSTQNNGTSPYRDIHMQVTPPRGGFLQYSDVWDSYDQWEHFIPEIPDGRPFLRCDRKNWNHFYFEGTVPDIPDIGDFYDECEPGCPKNRNSHKNPSIGKS